ncbi:MAG: hypothetical protein OEZ34_12610 [Spirochaetia bacterium]|nr:hypothetical protein [Spirochaetia bacterium]
MLSFLFAAYSALSLNCIYVSVIGSFAADGNPSEFAANTLYASDVSGDSSGPAGTDLRNLHIAADGNSNLLFHMSLDAALPNNTEIYWNLSSNYVFNIKRDGIGDYFWGADYSPNTNCQNQTANIAADGSGNIEVKIPYSCLQITPPTAVFMGIVNKWEVLPTPGIINYDEFNFGNSSCIFIPIY